MKAKEKGNNYSQSNEQLSFLNDEDKEHNKKNNIRPIHYLGSKLRALEFIKDIIDELDPAKGRVCDLFAGSGTVSMFLAKERAVTAVDIQEYSRVICSALLNDVEVNEIYVKNLIKKVENSICYKNLSYALQLMIEYEKNCVELAENGDLQPLCEFVENASLVRVKFGYIQGISDDLLGVLKETTKRLTSIGYVDSGRAQLSILYGGIYFSYEQTLILDSIIDIINSEDTKYKDILMAALLSTASDIVNTVGKQFAQPIKAYNKNGTPKKSILKTVNRDRMINALELYEKWANVYINHEKVAGNNQVLKMDYSDALDILPDDISVVYADPPYTRYHYSRYYHVLETISLHDNPNITRTINDGVENISRGIYREDRHQSPFSIKTKAKYAFENMISKVYNLNADLVISYSPFDESKKEAPRLMTIAEITELASKYFANVEVKSIGNFFHSRLNITEKNSDISYEAEILIICRR